MENQGLMTTEERLLPLADILYDEELTPDETGLIETGWLSLGDRAGTLFVTILYADEG
ncbi:MAG: hypothetical protein CMLOHMNK_02041 [Steroidobacteraceae bacterium]|nr:hypothetical protein [Steroidobacteraceae bacterium]